jgi:hypothetical protein
MSGGVPFLSFDLTVDYSQAQHGYCENLQTSLSSNGALVTEEHLKMVKATGSFLKRGVNGHAYDALRNLTASWIAGRCCRKNFFFINKAREQENLTSLPFLT